MTYPDRLEDQDQYTGLGAQKHFSSSLFSVVFPEKIHWSSDQIFHSTSNSFEMA